MKSSVNICFGKLMILIGLLCLLPLLMVVFYPQDLKYSLSFVYSGLFSIGIGAFLYAHSCKKRGSSKENRPALGKKSALVVVGTWLWAILIGALPFVFSGQLPLIQSLFESTSGWTTTGLSVMDVSQVPHIFLFHRSFMQFLWRPRLCDDDGHGHTRPTRYDAFSKRRASRSAHADFEKNRKDDL